MMMARYSAVPLQEEYNKLGDGQTDSQSVNIEELSQIISKNNATAEQEEEEKNILLESDFDLQPAATSATPNGTASAGTTSTGTTSTVAGAAVTVSDFSDDPKALDAKSKVQQRIERFGSAVMDEKAKVESRKRRFGAMNGEDPEVAAKRQKLDAEAQRKKVFERAQKFGTALPGNFKLTV